MIIHHRTVRQTHTTSASVKSSPSLKDANPQISRIATHLFVALFTYQRWYQFKWFHIRHRLSFPFVYSSLR